MQDENPIQERASVPRPKGPRGPQPQPIPGKKPGVGYVPRGMSYAGLDHGYSPVAFDLSVDLEGVPPGDPYIQKRAKMVAGGNVQQAQAGAPGIKPDQLGQILRRAWEARADFLESPEEYNGIATDTEMQRAFYAQKGDAALNNFASGIFARDNPPAATPPAQPVPPGASLQGVESLTPPQFAAVQAMINVLVQKGGAQ